MALPPELLPPPSLRDRLLHPRGWWLVLGLALIPLALIPVIALARYTSSSSDYCLTCHATGDTPDRGVRSLVHPDFKEVGCVDCHARPGQVVFEGYVKGFMAEPERVSPNCIRCHEGITQTDAQEGFKYNFLDIRITHQPHLERGASCVSCHVNVAHDLSPVPTNRPRMEACYSCHARNDTCAKCHVGGIPQAPPPLPAPASPDMLGDGRVYYLRICSACHGPGGDRVAGAQLFSREYLEGRGAEGLYGSISNGQERMHGFGLARGGPLSPEQIKAIIGYLEEEATGGPQPQPEALFKRYCLTCHGEEGEKVAGVALFSPEQWRGREEGALLSAIQQGKGGMPPFGRGEGGNLTREEMEALLKYLREKVGALHLAPPLDGQALYQKFCALCHPAAAAVARPEEDLARAIREGKGVMPPLGRAKGGPLGEDEVLAIIRFILGR